MRDESIQGKTGKKGPDNALYARQFRPQTPCENQGQDQEVRGIGPHIAFAQKPFHQGGNASENNRTEEHKTQEEPTPEKRVCTAGLHAGNHR